MQSEIENQIENLENYLLKSSDSEKDCSAIAEFLGEHASNLLAIGGSFGDRKKLLIQVLELSVQMRTVWSALADLREQGQVTDFANMPKDLAVSLCTPQTQKAISLLNTCEQWDRQTSKRFTPLALRQAENDLIALGAICARTGAILETFEQGQLLEFWGHYKG